MDQPQVSSPAVALPFHPAGMQNSGNRGRASSPGDLVDDVAVRATGRRARRHQRRAEQTVRPEVYELVARHEDGRMIQHRSRLDLIRNVADELRAEGVWRLFWKPPASRRRSTCAGR